MSEKFLKIVANESPDDAVEAFKQANTVENMLELFREASKVREENLGNVFRIIGHQGNVSPCTVNPPCRFCSLSSSLKEYREERNVASIEDIIKNSKHMVERGATVLLYGGGISPLSGRIAIKIADSISDKLNAEMMFNVGPVDEETVEHLKGLGVRRFVLSLETTDMNLFKDARPGDSFEDKISFIRLLESKGIGVSVILMNGVGTEEDLIRSIASLKNFRNIVGLRISTFNPVPGTPWESRKQASVLSTLKACAIARLLFPRAQIDLAAGTPAGVLQLSFMAGCGNEVVGIIMGTSYAVDRIDALRAELSRAGMSIASQ